MRRCPVAFLGTLSFTLLLSLAGCEGEPLPAVGFSADGGGVRVFEGVECGGAVRTGCACEAGTSPVECLVDPAISGGDLICGAGQRFCQDGAWSECRNVEQFTIPGGAAMVDPAVGCNPCDPECFIARDRPEEDDLTPENSGGVEYDPGAGGIVVPTDETGSLPPEDDRDRDGIPDVADECPAVAGVPEFRGCPPGSTGFECPPGARCSPVECGDGLPEGIEECDDGNTDAGDGCSPTCSVEIGFVCGAGTAGGGPDTCEPTECGDGIVEGNEPCDDGNVEIGDGCTPFCQLEPNCTGGVCNPTCGDGNVYIVGGPTDEECDDGNTRDGDGCSSACELEDGFMCTLTLADPPPVIELPIVYRDFIWFNQPGSTLGHDDFGTENNPNIDLDYVEDRLDAEGKPVYNAARVPLPDHLTTPANFREWYRPSPRNRTIPSTMAFARQPDGTYVFDSTAFFPLNASFDDLPPANRPWTATGEEDPRTGGNNFHFTSEVRFWFQYAGGERLDFRGDDDVWVFINDRLAVDIGAVHPPQAGGITLDAVNAAALGLTVGGIYEAVVFQAERQVTGSNYRLTLSNFFQGRTECTAICGDGIVTPAEVCDDGVNDGSPGSCEPGCLARGPLQPPGIYRELRFGSAPVVETCTEAVEVRRADVYFLIDASASMATEITALQDALTLGNLFPTRPECAGGIAGAIRCTVPDVQFGVGEVRDYPALPYGAENLYAHLADMSPLIGPTRTAIGGIVAAGGGDAADGQTQGLYMAATGGPIPGLVADRLSATFPACPISTFGYPCFRDDAQPIIFLITDADAHNGFDATADYDPVVLGGTPIDYGDVTTALVDAGIKVVGLDASGGAAATRNELVALANATNALDDMGNPLVFDIGAMGGSVGSSIATAIGDLAEGSRVDISAVPRDTTPANGIDETGFISSIRAASFSGGTCVAIAGDRFLGCTSGTEVVFEVVLQNNIVMEIPDDSQIFDFVLDILYDDSLVAQEKPVRIVVPPEIPACATLEVETDRIIPNVTIVIDESGSMNSGFTGAASRWEAVRDTLFGTTGDCNAFRTGGGNYDLCAANEATCEGRVVSGRDCDELCGLSGQVCAQAFDLAGGGGRRNYCNPAATTKGCDDTVGDSYCICEYADPTATTGADTSTGVIGSLEDQVRFGLTTYTSRQYEDASSCAGPSDGVNVVALDNLAATKGFFERNHPDGGTPTAEALREVYDDIVAMPPPDGPSVVILATDGSPNGCSNNSRADVVAQVERGFGNGIRTFVVSVGTGVAATHLQNVANAGVGVVPGDPDADFFVAGNAMDLTDDIRGLVTGVISCELDTTNGTIAEDIACSGVVTLNGRELTCEDPNGWERVDDNTIRINGTACDELTSDGDAVVRGRFPCLPATGRYVTTYEAFDPTGRCEPGVDRVLWGDLTYDISTPADTRIELILDGADTVAGLGANPPIVLQVPPTVSPVNLDTLFTATTDFPRSPGVVRVTAFLFGSPDRLRSPVLREISIAYNCDDGA